MDTMITESERREIEEATVMEFFNPNDAHTADWTQRLIYHKTGIYHVLPVLLRLVRKGFLVTDTTYWGWYAFKRYGLPGTAFSPMKQPRKLNGRFR